MLDDYKQTWLKLQTTEEGRELLQSNLNAYIKAGLEHFNENDGFDISFKAMLWQRYNYWSFETPTNQQFIDWYLNFTKE